MLCARSLSKAFGARRLFADLNWQIGAGERVGLIGDNGAGKTTLLRMLAGELEADGGDVHLSAGERLGYLPQEMPRAAVGSILARAASGDRRLQAAQTAVDAATSALARSSGDGPAEMMQRADALADAQHTFEQLGGADYLGRVEQALSGLGFARARFDEPVANLSGGWAMRVELARLLVALPDYLLLDEPTNHLDAGSLVWLANFLGSYRGSWIIVSHDHAFLNAIVERTAALVDEQLVVVDGNLAEYEAHVAAWQAEQASRGRRQAMQAAHLRAFIDRFGAKASKARQAQSKAKALAKLTANEVAAPKSAQSLRIRMPKSSRCAQQVLRAEGIAFGFGDHRLFAGLSFALGRGERLAIVGHNGAGKSTLLRLLARELVPQAGQVELGEGVRPYLFGQHQAEALPLESTVLAAMQAVMPGQNDTAIRTLLAAFLFRAEAMQRRVGLLSGGEKSRLALARMVAAPTNLLLLDEPTNHLDTSSKAVLAEALRSHDGAMVLISHDDALVTEVATCFVELDGKGGARFGYRRPDMRSQPVEKAATAPRGKAEGGAKANRKGLAAAERKLARHVAELEEQVQAAEARLIAIDQQLSAPEIFADITTSGPLLAERRELDEHILPQRLAAWEAAAEKLEAQQACDPGDIGPARSR